MRHPTGWELHHPDHSGHHGPDPFIAADLVAVALLVFACYFPPHRRRDLVVAYLTVNVGVLAVALVLGSSAIGAGLGLGLFAVLSIIRLRSSEIEQHEVAYYFAALALGLLGGLGASLGWLTIGLMALVLAVLAIGDHPALFRRYRQQTIVLDRAISDERGLTVKDRIPVDPEATAELDGEARAYADRVLADAGIDELGDRRLVPTLTTSYRRANPLVPPTGDQPASRATIDVDLRWMDRGRDGRFGRSLETPSSAIVETKSGSRPGAVDRALWATGHRPARVSKYDTGLAAMRPGLPANRWARVLDRHFADSPLHRPLTPAPTPERNRHEPHDERPPPHRSGLAQRSGCQRTAARPPAVARRRPVRPARPRGHPALRGLHRRGDVRRRCRRLHRHDRPARRRPTRSTRALRPPRGPRTRPRRARTPTTGGMRHP